jgi:hypothetical protein
MPAHDATRAEVLARLERDGLVRCGPDGTRPTRRWQGAMARAALTLVCSDSVRWDLRYPITLALVEIYGVQESDGELAALVEVLLVVEEGELSSLLQAH